MKTCILMNNNSYVGREYLYRMHQKGLKADVICLGEFISEDPTEEDRCGKLWQPALQSELEQKFSFFFFPSLKSASLLEHLTKKAYDYGIQGGTGILKNEVIRLFKIGILNFHPGHLPEYRGCSAPEWQLYEGKDVYSSCHLIDQGIDTGPLVRIKKLEVDKRSYAHFRASIYPETAKFVCEVLENINSYSIFTPQNEALAQYRPYIGDEKIQVLKNKLASTLKIRRARSEDCVAIHEIRNEEEIRRTSFDPSEIPLESHRLWFAKTLHDEKRRLFVVTENESVLGVVRFDLNAQLNQAEVSIFVSRKAQGKGVGKFALLEGEMLLKQELPICKSIIAKALIENQRSLEFFKSCEYRPRFVELIKE